MGRVKDGIWRDRERNRRKGDRQLINTFTNITLDLMILFFIELQVVVALAEGFSPLSKFVSGDLKIYCVCWLVET